MNEIVVYRNIDRWLNWYKKLCIDIDAMPYKISKQKRCLLISWQLSQRHILDPKNATKSEFWAKSFMKIANELQKELDELDTYFLPLQKDKLERTPLFYFITFAEWLIIERLRDNHIIINIENLESDIEKSILEPKAIAQKKLNELSKETIFYLSYFESGQPLQSGNFDLYKLVNDIDKIDFSNYLLSIIENNQSEVKQPAEPITPAEIFSEVLEPLDRVGYAYKYCVWDAILERTDSRTEAYMKLSKITGISISSAKKLILAISGGGKSITHIEQQMYSDARLEPYRTKVKSIKN